jgi:hypothetical protein
MRTYGGSEFDENDFLLFAENIKELTYKTFHELALENDESPGYKENVKEELRKYKVYIKEELLDSYMKKSKFNDLNDMIVKAAKDENYVGVASSGSDEMYDFTGLTKKILKKIGISYVLTPGELNSIRALLESPDSEGATETQDAPSISSIRSRTSSIRSRTSSSGSRGRTKNKPSKKTKGKKKKKKKPTKKKKKKHTKRR